MYQNRITKYFARYSSLLIALGITSLLGSVILYTFVDLLGSPLFIITSAQVAIITLASISVFTVLWRRGVVTALSVMSVLIIAGSLLMPIQETIPSTYNELDSFNADDRNKVKHLVWRYEPAGALTPASSAVMFYMGAGLLGLCMIIVYRPSLLYVKNRPSDDPPYPIWDSSHGYTTYKYRNMVPLYTLLTTAEKYLIPQYRFVQVKIGDKIYLVTPSSDVPDDSIVIRDPKSNFFMGVMKTYG